MKLNIDGREVQARAGESLLDMITKMGLRTGNFADEPLAAKIAGDVFTLNYIPLREKDVLPDRESKRRAMAASGGKIRLLRYADAQGRAAYTRTAQFGLARGKGNRALHAGDRTLHQGHGGRSFLGRAAA